jgi:hypothetical protein
VRIEIDPDLRWFYQDSQRELGLQASPIMPQIGASNVPEQHWPSAGMCRAARKQRDIRAALRQLSHRLQSILECAYGSREMTLQEKHKYDLAAPLIARVLTRMKMANKEEQKQLKALVQNLPRLLEAAHAAFRIAYGPPEPKSRRERVRRRVDRWMAEEGLRV